MNAAANAAAVDERTQLRRLQERAEEAAQWLAHLEKMRSAAFVAEDLERKIERAVADRDRLQVVYDELRVRVGDPVDEPRAAPAVDRLHVLADEVSVAAQRLAHLQASRRHGFDAGRELEISRARERSQALQDEFDELRRRTDEATAAEAARLEAGRLSSFPALEARRDKLTHDREVAFGAVEAALAELVAAIGPALTADVEVQQVEVELGERGHRRTVALISDRVRYELLGAGLRDFGAVMSHGREPLAAAAPARSSGSRSNGTVKPKAPSRLPAGSTAERPRARKGV